MALGWYFIYEGNVLERFHQKKTNFAEHAEPVRELPTAVTWIEYSTPITEDSKLKLGRDFSITLWAQGSYELTELVHGENDVKQASTGGHVTIQFQEEENLSGAWGSSQTFRIYPQGVFANGVPRTYFLAYSFKNQTTPNKTSISRIGLALTTKNNSYCGFGDVSFDGEITDVFTNLGESKWLSVQPKKVMFNRQSDICREKPYHETLLKEISANMLKKCGTACRLQTFKTCYGDTENQHLQTCKSKAEEQCFWEAKKAAKESIVLKPCTELMYKVEVSTYNADPHQAQFVIDLVNPPSVIVKEEYLIYDLVSMISAIGGTMGLCIGFSFRDLTHWLLRRMEKGIKPTNVRSVAEKMGRKIKSRKTKRKSSRSDFI